MRTLSTLTVIGAVVANAESPTMYCNLFDTTKKWKTFHGDTPVSWAVGPGGDFVSVLKHAKECQTQKFKGIAVGFFKLGATEKREVFCTNLLEKIDTPKGVPFHQVDSGVQLDCASTKCWVDDCKKYDDKADVADNAKACKWYFYNHKKHDKKDMICKPCSFSKAQEEVLSNAITDSDMWKVIKESGCGTTASKELADIDEYGGTKPYSVYGVSDYDVNELVGLVSDKCLVALDEKSNDKNAIKEACSDSNTEDPAAMGTDDSTGGTDPNGSTKLAATFAIGTVMTLFM